MTAADETPVTGHAPDLRIGTPERESARAALDAHLVEQRLDPTEHERRVIATGLAHTRSELLKIFRDLPAPHPDLPAVTPPSPLKEEDGDIPAVAVSGCLMIGLGVPVAIVLGIVYGWWWALAVPVGLTAVLPLFVRGGPSRDPAR